MSFRSSRVPASGLDPDAPVPFALTKKAEAALARGQRLAAREPGVCRACGNFGTGDPQNPCKSCGMA